MKFVRNIFTYIFHQRRVMIIVFPSPIGTIIGIIKIISTSTVIPVPIVLNSFPTTMITPLVSILLAQIGDDDHGKTGDILPNLDHSPIGS